MADRSKKGTPLTFLEILSAKALFNSKGWSKGGLAEDGVCDYDDFCQWLTCFNPEERKLLLKLSKDYVVYRPPLYPKGFMDSFKKLMDQIADREFTEIVLFASDGGGETKSENFLYYLLKGSYSRQLQRYAGTMTVSFTENEESVKGRYSRHARGSVCICLIDDFIGSGNSIRERVDDLVGCQGVDRNDIAVASIVALRQGFECLKNYVYVSSSLILDKGIHHVGADAVSETRIMEQIENHIGVDDICHTHDMHFGYMRSEALVTMARTPNNTFPVYWMNDRNRLHVKCPFER